MSIAYTTEESDDPDNPNGIIEHKNYLGDQQVSIAIRIKVMYYLRITPADLLPISLLESNDLAV